MSRLYTSAAHTSWSAQHSVQLLVPRPLTMDGHLRSDSTARRRLSVSQQATSSALPRTVPSPYSSKRKDDQPELDDDVPLLKRSGSSKGARHDYRARVQRIKLLKIVTAGLVTVLLVRFAFQRFTDASLDRRIRMRRERMQRSRTAESHVLPRKYREPVSGHAQPLQQLEECKRIMLYTFKDSQGFASELNALLTAAVIAQRTSRVLLVNDVDWNYGALTDYFLPRKIFCHPPKDWFL